jgi:hypothetical protein
MEIRALRKARWCGYIYLRGLKREALADNEKLRRGEFHLMNKAGPNFGKNLLLSALEDLVPRLTSNSRSDQESHPYHPSQRNLSVTPPKATRAVRAAMA